jgi:hypothetical protein
MKKILTLALAAVMALSLVACGGNNNETTAPETTVPAVETTAPVTETTAPEVETTAPVTADANGATTVLQNIWNNVEEKWAIIGGSDAENPVWDAPGNYDLADENISFNLLIPADQIANVDDVASMTHGMMANNFNSAVFHVTADVKGFADALYQSVSGNMWMCGMPDRVVIASIGSYVVMFYGVNDALTSFETHLMEAYPQAETLYNESLV